MKALFYLLSRTYINMVKRLFAKPLAAVFTVLMLACILVPSILRVFSGKTFQWPSLFEAVIGGGVLFYGFMILLLMLGQNNGIFYMSDVNLLFTSPLSQKKILVYGVLNTFLGSIIFSLFIMAWVPSIAGSGIPAWGYPAALLPMVLLTTLIILVYYLAYLKNISRANVIRVLKALCYLVVFLILAAFAGVAVYCSFDMQKAAIVYFNSMAFNLLPIFGWVKWGISSALRGNFLTGWLPSTGLEILLAGLLSFFILRSDADYYEQVATDAQRAQAVVEKARAGKLDTRSAYVKKIREGSVTFRKGAAAILSRQVLEMKKAGALAGNMNALFIFVYVFIFSFMGLDIQSTVYILIFTSMGLSSNDAWASDFKKPFVYLLPDSSVKKVFYATLVSLIKSAITGTLAFLVLFLLKRPPLAEFIGLFALYLSYTALFLYAAVFAQRIAGSQSNPFVVMMLRMMIALASSIPSIAILIVFVVLSGGAPTSLSVVLSSVLANLLISAALVFFSRKLFETSELMD